ncbi:MAG: hypothetical protein AAF467_04680 [Actinomycetota bacterium]
MTPRRVLAGTVLGCVAIGLSVGSPFVAVVGPMLVLLGGRVLRRARARRRRRARADDLAAFVDRIQHQVRAGAPLGPALRADSAWPLDPPTALSPPDLELVHVALGVLTQQGGAALHSLDRLGDTLRARRAVDDETRAQAAQAATSATLLAALPALSGAVLALLEPSLAAFYLREVLGAACAAAAVAGSYVSWNLIDRLTWGRP